MKAQLGLLKSTMLQLDPAFTERDYGTNAFSDFVHKLSSAGHVKLHRREGNYVVERVEGQEQPQSPPAPAREEIIPMLRSVLLSNLSFVSVGIPAKELAALFHAAHPGVNHQDYGFTDFQELLNLAQDKGLVRNEADPERGVRVFPGTDLAGPQEQASDEAPALAGGAEVNYQESGEAMPEAQERAPRPPARKPSRRRLTRSKKPSVSSRRAPSRKKVETAEPIQESM